jgi:hypothetical protein
VQKSANLKTTLNIFSVFTMLLLDFWTVLLILVFFMFFILFIHCLLICLFVCLVVFNATFYNILVISWRSVLLVEKVTDKLYHIVLYTSP